MTQEDIRPLDEQIYDLLTNSKLTYRDIGKQIGIAPQTVAKHVRRIVMDYNFNPSLMRNNKKQRYYARYCQNMICHEVCYFTPLEIKGQDRFYCSDLCEKNARGIQPPSEGKIRDLYKKNGFSKTAQMLDMSIGTLARIFEHYDIEPEEFPENVLVTPANIAQRQTQRIKQRRSTFSHTRAGHRKYLGHAVRSSWENNFALYLVHKKIRYEYEPTVFYYPEKTGARSYLPDFKLTQNGKEIWVEVKGRMTSKDRTKMTRLKKHHPEIFAKMTYVVDKKGSQADLSYKKIGLKPYAYYDELTKEFGHKLKNWE